MIVIGGGDGTLSAAASGVIQTRRPLGILPTGTANDLARTLDIPKTSTKRSASSAKDIHEQSTLARLTARCFSTSQASPER
jgi:diacylglycerol kinase family enzyme